jgi:hypothetical protein
MFLSCVGFKTPSISRSGMQAHLLKENAIECKLYLYPRIAPFANELAWTCLGGIADEQARDAKEPENEIDKPSKTRIK